MPIKQKSRYTNSRHQPSGSSRSRTRRRRTWRRGTDRRRKKRRATQCHRRGSRKHTRTPRAPRGTTSLRAFEKLASFVDLAPELANNQLLDGVPPSAGPPDDRPSPASPSSAYTGRQTAPRTTMTHHCPCPRSALFRYASLLAHRLLPPRCRVNTSNHPQRFKNCLSRLANSAPPCTRVVHGTR